MSCLARFLDTLQSYSSLPCIEDKSELHTYGELWHEMACWRSRFDHLGVEQGAVIGVRSDYSLASVAVLLALLSRRAIAALIPGDASASSYLTDACASALLELDTDGGYEWHSRLEVVNHTLLGRLRDARDGGLVLFTSGSTGRPKAALQSSERLLRKFRSPGRRFRTLAFLLFDHVAGVDTLLYTLGSGGTLILARHRDPRSILELIESHRVEVLPTSPSFLRLLCAAEVVGRYDLSSLKIITYGAEPMDSTTLSRLNQRFPGIQISQKYGTTETGSPRSVSRGNDSLWIRFNGDGVEIKVVENVLWIRSESTILGYLNAPQPLDGDGWYCTGDLVEVDGEWVKFRGRNTDIINVGGEKVSPVEVEQVILELDFVCDVVVAGEPHPLLGQVVTARVVLAAGQMEQREATKRIWLHCRQRLARYKAPVKVAVNSTGVSNRRQKIKRK